MKIEVSNPLHTHSIHLRIGEPILAMKIQSLLGISKPRYYGWETIVFENIIATLTSGFRTVIVVFVPSRNFTTFQTL